MGGTAPATEDRGQQAPHVRIMAQHATENFARIVSLSDRAKKEKRTLSALLEDLDPSTQYGPDMPLDSFERMLMVQGIRVQPDRKTGTPASTLAEFERDEKTMILGAEWIRRTYTKAFLRSPRYSLDARDPSLVRLSFNSDDLPAGSVLRPYFDQAELRMAQIAPAIPLDQLIAQTNETNQVVTRAPYLTEPTTSQIRMVRVAEGAEIPRTKIATRQQVGFLHKYGRAVEITYEAMRQTPIDMVALLLTRIAVQADIDKVATVMDVIINGDGNAGTAATSVNLTTLDPATTANNLTLIAWLNYLLQFPNPYTLTTALANNNVVLKVMTLNVGTANTMLAQVQGLLGVGTITPINPEFSGAVRIGATADAPANKIVGIDKRFAVQRWIEAGSDIQETVRWIQRQVQFLALTETEGYGIIDANASKVLNLAA